jgi:ATP-dependent DNA ligase
LPSKSLLSGGEAVVCDATHVRFTEWTKVEKLRHPVFLGLRVDKKPIAVVRQEA